MKIEKFSYSFFYFANKPLYVEIETVSKERLGIFKNPSVKSSELVPNPYIPNSEAVAQAHKIFFS